MSTKAIIGDWTLTIPPVAPEQFWVTTDGAVARIYATDGGGAFPVHGALSINKCWLPQAWDSNGKSYDENRSLSRPVTKNELKQAGIPTAESPQVDAT